jgi:hypothetical protein
MYVDIHSWNFFLNLSTSLAWLVFYCKLQEAVCRSIPLLLYVPYIYYQSHYFEYVEDFFFLCASINIGSIEIFGT